MLFKMAAFCQVIFTHFKKGSFLNSRLSRCSTARGSSAGFSWLVPLRLRLISIFYSLKVPFFESKVNVQSLALFISHQIIWKTFLLLKSEFLFTFFLVAQNMTPGISEALKAFLSISPQLTVKGLLVSYYFSIFAIGSIQSIFTKYRIYSMN